MTESGFGHHGRIPHYGGGQPDGRNMVEPPACIQNAMMTKDKKPFTYTPGGLDLSQIRTPSMARRLARQRSQEEHEHAYAASNGQAAPRAGGAPPPVGGAPPPPPPFQAGPPPPPPPPPLVIHTPAAGTAKPETVIRPIGERPEIVIPENPIGMLRKTNSPYHWEQEKADKERMGGTPKFVEKAPSPAMMQNPPTAFSQQPPSSYSPQIPNNAVRQNYPYGAAVNQVPESPLHKPEPQYPAKPSVQSPGANVPTPTRDLLQRQDSQFNKSPTPFGPQGSNSAPSNNSPISPSPNSSWRQPERRESPAVPNQSPHQRNVFSPTIGNRSPQVTPNYTPSPTYQNESPSPAVYHTLPRASPRVQDNYNNNIRQSPPRNLFNNTIYNNVRNEPRPESPKFDSSNAAPWRSNTLNRNQREPENNNYAQNNNINMSNPPFYKPNEPNPKQQNNLQQNPWKTNEQTSANQWKTNQQISPNQWKSNQQTESTSPPIMQNQLPGDGRYQSHISIPVTPRNPQQPTEPERHQTQSHPDREVVYVTQEPVYYHNPESPKAVPLWVKPQKEKTPPPEWCQRPLEGRKSLTKEVVSPPSDKAIQPEWVQKSNEMRSAPRDLSSPPLSHQNAQPTWSTKPSDNRKSLPSESQPTFNHGTTQNGQGSRVIPVQVQGMNYDTRDNGNQLPQLRVIVDMQQPQGQAVQPPYSQPTQRIMRVLSPQLVRMDREPQSNQPDLPSLSNNQPRTRIIPIKLEGGGNDAPNRRVYYHHFTCEGPPRQSKAFRVLQTITGTMDADFQGLEEQQGFSDL